MRGRASRGPRAAHGRLAALATAATTAGTALVLAVAARHVSRAHIEVTRDEARMAAALWEAAEGAEGGGTGGGAPGAPGAAAVRAFLGDRATIEPLDARGAGTLPGTPAYEAGALEPAAWIAVTPRERGRAWPGRATIVALLGILAMTGWAARTARSAPRVRYPRGAAAGTVALLAVVAAAAHGWAGRGAAGTRRLPRRAGCPRGGCLTRPRTARAPHGRARGFRRGRGPGRRADPLAPSPLCAPARVAPHPHRLGVPRSRGGPTASLHLRAPALLLLDLAARVAPRGPRPSLHGT